MNWFYAKDGQPAGPVDDEEFERLIAAGVVRGTTLVWRSGLAEWKPCAEIRPPPLHPVPPLPTDGAGSKSPSSAGVQNDGDAFGSVISPNRGAAPGLPYAGFWIRLAAGLLDVLILLPVFVILNLSFVVAFPDFLAASAGGASVRTFFNLALLTIGALYYGGLVGRFGATPGKWVCNLRVIGEEGERISYGRALGRFFCVAVFFGADLILVVMNEQKCALHDLLCNTRVIHID